MVPRNDGRPLGCKDCRLPAAAPHRTETQHFPHVQPIDGVAARASYVTRHVTAMSADAMLDKGDLDGAALWRQVFTAIYEFQRVEPKLGEARHSLCES